MVLNLINFIQAGILWGIIIPELLFSIHHGAVEAKPKNKIFSIIEQIGRYASMLLMILPLGINEFGFGSPEETIIYFAANGALLLIYIIIFVLFFRKPNFRKAMVLAIIRIAVFLLCGILLRHSLLIISVLIFAVGHIPCTIKVYKEA